MIGVFVSLNTVLFYIFWEGMLVPMYLLIAVWGGPRRDYASIKFFLYTFAGSIFLLVAIIALYITTGTFFIPALMDHSYPFMYQLWLFLAFALSFAIKIPMYPLHTWLPAAHVEAPTAGSVILASILLKMGGYGFLRFCLPMAPAATYRLHAVHDRHLPRLDHPRRLPGARPVRHQETDRLLQRRPHGVRHPRHFPAQRPGAQGGDAADDQPRHHHRRPVHLRRNHLRADPQQGDRRQLGAWERRCRFM